MNQHSEVIIIGGYGHVGLPLGIALAETGLQVGLYDIDTSKRSVIESGTMPFLDDGAEQALKECIGSTLQICDNLDAVQSAHTIIITIGTPLDSHHNPNTGPLLDVCTSLLPHLRDDHLLILRSTVCPGTLDQLTLFFNTHNKKPKLAYCCERIVQGQAYNEVKTLPQIIAGTSNDAFTSAAALFAKLGIEILELTPREAELSKLYLNAWRYIQFATANQFYMLAEEHGVDFQRIHKAMTYKYDRAKNFPKAGFSAGPCLFKDTMQLAASSILHFGLGYEAIRINEGLPQFVVHQIEQNHTLAGTTIGILGMAFKNDNDDTRDSLSFKLRKLLRQKGATVICSDEYAADPDFVSKEELIETCSIIVIGAPHTMYRNLRFPDSTNVFDVWGLYSTTT